MQEYKRPENRNRTYKNGIIAAILESANYKRSEPKIRYLVHASCKTEENVHEYLDLLRREGLIALTLEIKLGKQNMIFKTTDDGEKWLNDYKKEVLALSNPTRY